MSLFTPVIQEVHIGILARLADPTYGFNANFLTALSTSGYSMPPEADTPINWAITGPNVSFGRLSNPVDQLPESENADYPFVIIDVIGGRTGRRILFQRYSGPVKAAIQFLLSWEAQQIVDFASWQNATIDAMVATFNAPANGVAWYPGAGITYAGEMEFSKSPVRPGGSGWIAVVEFGLNFEVTIQ